LFDQYDNLVKTDNDSLLYITIEVDSSQEFEAFLTQTQSISSTRGLFIIEALSITSTPGTTQTVSFTSLAIDDTVPSNEAYLTSIGATEAILYFAVEVNNCEIGQELLANGA
jgi:hypothetical protein